MSLSMIEKFHEFECRLCGIKITLDYNSSNEQKIIDLKKHQDVKHFQEFEGGNLDDMERIAFFIGNQIYIKGLPEKPFNQ